MSNTDIKAKLLEAAAMHVPFDGWSEVTFQAAIKDADVTSGLARAAFPRGAVDMALAFHAAGDQAMVDKLTTTDQTGMRYRDRVALAVRTRLEVVEDKEMVRRGMTLFSLPMHAPDGARALWQTCDRIWTALGDNSSDVNWYTKRATLSGVYGSTVLYWLGDDSEDHERTWDFLDRRIDNVMQIEMIKAKTRDNRVLSGLMKGPMSILDRIKPPSRTAQNDMPGRWSGPV